MTGITIDAKSRADVLTLTWWSGEVGHQASYLKWERTPEGPKILVVHTKPGFRRQGFATALRRVLEALEGPVVPSSEDETTPMGRKWLEGIREL